MEKLLGGYSPRLKVVKGDFYPLYIESGRSTGSVANHSSGGDVIWATAVSGEDCSPSRHWEAGAASGDYSACEWELKLPAVYYSYYGGERMTKEITLLISEEHIKKIRRRVEDRLRKSDPDDILRVAVELGVKID